MAAPKPQSNRQPPGHAPIPIKRTRILLADDHPVVRKGIAMCLEGHDRLEIVGEAADGDEAVRKAIELRPDVILMDVDMPGLSGLTAVETLRKELPKTKVLLLSMSNNQAFVPRILKSGARGFVSKDAPTEELIRAIEAVESGATSFSDDMARVALQQLAEGPSETQAELTNRERQVLIGVASGRSNKEIASDLNISTRTVESHRESLMRKLNIHGVGGLTKYALATGLITLREGNGR
jgi:DNA-binding NarL/FixJ family response regulator